MTATSPQPETVALIPWDEIRAEWRRRKYVAASRAVRGLLEADVRDRLYKLLFTETQPTDDVARKALADALVAAAAKEPAGALLTALYVYGLCLQKWETSDEYGWISDVLALLDDESKRVTGDDEAVRLLSILVRQARLVDAAMGVENAMSCSCPLEMRGLATGIVRDIAGLAEEERAIGEGFDGVRKVMQADAATSAVYFETIAKVADAVLAFVEADTPAWASFSGILDEVEAAQRHEALAGDVYDSELRAHAASLAALGEHAGRPRLRIDAAKLVYVYPFTLQFPSTLREMGAEETVQSALAKEKPIENALEKAGFTPASTRAREVNDIWDRDGRAEPGYAGASIALPPLTVVTTAYRWLEHERHKAEARLKLNVEVRLSRLGNHHLRITARLKDADLHDVNQALRRGSGAMGAEKLSSGTRDEAWDTLEEYADEVIDTIAGAVAGAKKVTNPNARSHVVLAARAISVLEPGVTSAATIETLGSSVGATLLFHPVRNLATSLEEWIRYPPAKIHNVLDDGGYVGDLVVRTHNTTVLYMPSSPEWLVEEYEEMVEFVASLPPLLTLWGNRARDEAADVERQLCDEVLPKLQREISFLNATGDTSAKESTASEDAQDAEAGEQSRPDGGDSEPAASEEAAIAGDGEKPPPGDGDPIGALYMQQVKIRELESDIQARLAFLRSPELCKTRGQRRFLDALWQAAGLRVLEKELDRQLSLLADQHARVTAMVTSIDEHYRREQQKRAERLERPVQFVLGLLAGASLLSVIQWVDAEVGDPSPAFAIESGILVVAAIAGVWLYWFRGGR